MIQALYQLSYHPQYIEPLREEIASVVAESGWSKKSIDRLNKLDSFIRETQRVAPLTAGESITPFGTPDLNLIYLPSLFSRSLDPASRC